MDEKFKNLTICMNYYKMYHYFRFDKLNVKQIDKPVNTTYR